MARWTTMAVETEPEAARLAGVLRIIGNPCRLQIIGLLEAGEQEVVEIAGALGLPARTVRRHLSILERDGLVRRLSTNGQRFAPGRHSTVLLAASFLSLLRQAGSSSPSGGSFLTVGVQPTVALSVVGPCLECQNSAYMRRVLEDLDRLQEKARQYQSRLQQLSSQVLTAQEQERKRIARELHDDTAQALTSILVRLRLLERSLEQGRPPEGLPELRALTEATLDGVRRLAVALRPTALDDLGLVAALRSFIRDFSRCRSIQVSITSNGFRCRLPPEVELALYRVVQEALSNVAKHSHADRASVRLQRTREAVIVVVEDSGCGFDVKKLLRDSQRGLGLFSMKERLALVGGSLHIDSSPQRGCRVMAWVPLAQHSHRHR